MILFNDFASEYKSIKNEINYAISKVLESGWFVLGKELEQFEKEFAKNLNVKYCAGVASGTDAITISLMTLNIGDGDEVITTNLTAFPTITGIIRSGAKPVVIDITLKDGLINYKHIEKKINKNTKAIIPVHLYGQCCEMEQINKIAKKHDLNLVEDCAQSLGSSYKSIQSGALGVMGAFSFYPTKNLGAYGDAGAIVTNSKKYYERILMIRNYGQSKKFQHHYKGFNSRMDEIQAAILRVKLRHLKEWIEKRRQIARYFDLNLKKVKPIKEKKYNKHAYHLYVLRSANRSNLFEHLKKNNIQSMIHYPIPVNKQKAFHYQKNENFPNTEILVDEILSIPIHHMLKTKDVKKIVRCINEFKR